MTKQMTPTTDENRFVAEDGTVFIAVVPLVFHTTGTKRCIQDCDACDLCESTPPCQAEFRKDRRNIVWKREAV